MSIRLAATCDNVTLKNAVSGIKSPNNIIIFVNLE
jgi:hypothetical protein